MPYYRIYSLDPSGHIKFAHDAECQDDQAALAEGEKETGKFDVEVWQGARLVGQIRRARNVRHAADAAGS